MTLRAAVHHEITLPTSLSHNPLRSWSVLGLFTDHSRELAAVSVVLRPARTAVGYDRGRIRSAAVRTGFPAPTSYPLVSTGRRAPTALR
jgi:hypothetical protein